MIKPGSLQKHSFFLSASLLTKKLSSIFLLSSKGRFPYFSSNSRTYISFITKYDIFFCTCNTKILVELNYCITSSILSYLHIQLLFSFSPKYKEQATYYRGLFFDATLVLCSYGTKIHSLVTLTYSHCVW